MKLKLLIVFITLGTLSLMFTALPAFSHFEWDANDVNAYIWDPNPDRMFSLQFANSISDKGTVTFGEVVKFFLLTLHGHFIDFEEDLAYLVRHNIAQGIKLGENDEINMGTLSLMTARTLELNNTLLYNIFKNKRYAVRACIAADLIPNNSGGLDKVSGEKLIELMRKIAHIWGDPR